MESLLWSGHKFSAQPWAQAQCLSPNWCCDIKVVCNKCSFLLKLQSVLQSSSVRPSRREGRACVCYLLVISMTVYRKVVSKCEPRELSLWFVRRAVTRDWEFGLLKYSGAKVKGIRAILLSSTLSVVMCLA